MKIQSQTIKPILGSKGIKFLSRLLFSVLISLVAQNSWAISACLSAPKLSSPSGNIIIVDSVAELESAVANLTDNSTIIIKPGRYELNTTLYITNNNITIRGESDSCDEVELIGKGMENENRGDVGSGIWINSSNVTVANLSISDVWFHPIEIQGSADSPRIYNVRLLNAGEQFIKASSGGGFGIGADFGIVEYTIMEYTNSPPVLDHGGGTGYTNGVDVHGGQGWIIRNNLFKNFHTPDNADHLWNPAILMWNGARDTISENNVFINVDRAIAYGLIDRANDHSGGVIRNNMIYMSLNLNSSSRRSNSDAPIIIWDSPNTKVLHNTVRTNNNTVKSIELRFDSSGVIVANNLVDAPIVYREGLSFTNDNNYTSAVSSLFVNESSGDLHLLPTATQVLNLGDFYSDAAFDFDGETRATGDKVDIGADEQSVLTPPVNPPSNQSITLPPIYDLLLN